MKAISNKKISVCLLNVGVALLFSGQLAANDWKISPSVSVKGTYTDNADLSSTDKKGQFYTQIRPSVAIKREGAGRIQLNANYALDYTNNRPGSRGRSVAHRLNSNMQAELYRDVIFLDVRAGARLWSLTSGGQRGSDSVGDVNNPVQSYNYSVSPYFKHHFGRYADMVTRYTFDQVINSGSSGLDSYSNQLSISINSGPHFTRFPWGINYRQSKTGNEGGRADSKSSSVNGTVSYVFSRKWRINLSGGKVDYDIQSSRSSTDSFTWDAGATWTPNARTDMKFSYGRQMFGKSFRFDFDHRWRRAAWRASYNRTLTNSRTQQLSSSSNAAAFSGTGSGYQSSGLGSADYATLTDEYYVIETVNTGFTLKTRRSSLGLNAHFTNRRYEVSRKQGRDIGVTANLSRQLTPKTDAKLAVSWQKNRADRNATESTRWTVSLGLNRRLTERTSAKFDYKYRRLDSTGSTGEYRENQISLSLASKW